MISIPDSWENVRKSVSNKAGRHAIIAGGAIRDHLLGLPQKDVDIFVLGMSAALAKEIFNADIVEYAGVEKAKHQYQTVDGLIVDLVFSQFDNVQDVLEHFDLGICRIAWDGVSLLHTKNNDFHRDLSNKTVTQFYPSPSGHADRVMRKLAPLGFTLKSPNDDDADDFESEVRRLALKRGYRLMHRRNGNYWLMPSQPMTLGAIYERLTW
jgi:hypothetical protein